MNATAADPVLTIDVGNLLTAVAVWESGRPVYRVQLGSDPRRTGDELGLLLARCLADGGIAPAAVRGAVVACVVPALSGAVVAACRQLLGRAPLVVGPGLRTGLAIRTEQPREVGADRIANAVAAVARRGAPVFIVDLATALSIDVVDAAGDYVGAVIAPGLEVSAEALARRTAQLARVPLVAPPSPIGDSTARSLQSGLVLGQAAMIDGLVARLKATIGAAPVIATGESGAAAAVVAECRSIDAFDPLLTLDGLYRIYHGHIERPIEHSSSARR